MLLDVVTGGWVADELLGGGVPGCDGEVVVGGAGSVVDGGAGSSEVDGGVLGSLGGVELGGAELGVGSALELGVSGSCASAPVVAAPNARTTAVVRAPMLSRARLTDLSDNGSPRSCGTAGTRAECRP